jgi:polyribonucleotide nucleotidyltransferase
LDLIVSASKSSIVMVEAGANEIEEAKVVDASVRLKKCCQRCVAKLKNCSRNWQRKSSFSRRN